MKICINEKSVDTVNGISLAKLAEEYKPGADLLILNGFPAPAETAVQEGDQIFLIRRGQQPGRDELENLMAARHTPGVHAKLKQACVGIAGVGGLGSAVAVALARIGVGRLIIADFDIVEPSNLNRQQYFIDQIGYLKVDALVENLSRINPYVRIESHPLLLTPENIPVIFDSCSIIIEAFDWAEMKAMLVDTVLSKLPQTTVIAASGLAGYGPNNTVATRKVSQRLYLVGDNVSEAKPGSGLMAPRVGIAAHHQANQAVRIILGEDQ